MTKKILQEIIKLSYYIYYQNNTLIMIQRSFDAQ